MALLALLVIVSIASFLAPSFIGRAYTPARGSVLSYTMQALYIVAWATAILAGFLIVIGLISILQASAF